MCNPSKLLSALATTCALLGCVNRGTTVGPFVVAPDSLFKSIQTIVVAPVDIPPYLDISGDAAAGLESALEQKLQEAGFSAVPSFEYLGIWQHIANEVGGFYDTYSGERDEELFNSATARLRAELSERFDVDGVLYSELWEGTAPFFDGVARWDGAAQAVFGARGTNGEVRALSLVVSVEDLAGTELYVHGFGFATIEAWHNNDWLQLDLDGVVGDARLVATAVENVLEPIVLAGMPDSSRMR